MTRLNLLCELPRNINAEMFDFMNEFFYLLKSAVEWNVSYYKSLSINWYDRSSS